MSNGNSMVGTDLYLKHVDVEGKAHLSRHRVWDAERFLTARQQEAAAENVKKGSTKARVELSTEEAFKATIRRK